MSHLNLRDKHFTETLLQKQLGLNFKTDWENCVLIPGTLILKLSIQKNFSIERLLMFSFTGVKLNL